MLLGWWQHVEYYGGKAPAALVVVALGAAAYLLIRRVLKALTRREMLAEPLAIILTAIARWVLVIVVVLLTLQQLGVHISGLWATLLGVGAMVAIGFVAVWSVLSNALCALLLMIYRPFGIGEDIEIIEATGGSGLRGTVTAFNMFNTSLREQLAEGEHAVVQVPNNTFFQKTIRRHGGGQESLVTHLLKHPIRRKPENAVEEPPDPPDDHPTS